MESKLQHTTNGQAIYQEDVNLLGEEAALADDRVFAELLRMLPFVTTAARGVMPYRVNGAPLAPDPDGAPLVLAGVGKVTVRPFRAFIGSRVAVGTGLGKTNWRDIRSVISIGASALDQDVTFDATAGGVHRIDLVYAAVSVDVDDAGVTRKVKSPTTGQVTSATVVVTKSTTVALGVVKGADNSTTPPAIPADAAGTYYIPLAYVHIPASFGGSTSLTPESVWEVAPPITLAESTGAASIRVADGNYRVDGTVQAQTPFEFSGRKPASMPATMVGGEELIFAMDLEAHPLDSHVNGSVIDASRDWTNRLFSWQVAADATGNTPKFPWQGIGSVPQVPDKACTSTDAAKYKSGMGQSFITDLSAGKCGVIHLAAADFACMNGGSLIDIYIDTSTGELKIDYSGAPGVKMFVWLRATAQFGNPE